MAKYNIESFYRGKIQEAILNTDTVPMTIRVNQTPTLTSGLLTISPNTENEEIVSYSAIDSVNSTITIDKRGIKPSSLELTTNGTDYNNTTYYKTHSPLDSIRGDINNIHLNSNVNKDGSNIFTGTNTFADMVATGLTFTGTTSSGIRLKSLTTTQRDALTPVDGDKIYNSTTGTEQTYYGGTWNDAGTGTTANASTTVSGKVEIADQTETNDGTETGGTGATLVVTPGTYQAGITAKIADQTTVDTGTDNTKFVTPLTFKTGITNKLASQAEAEAGSDNTKLMTPLRVAQAIPLASTTAGGRVEIATDAEVTAGTSTGGSGAILVPTATQIKKSISLKNSITTLDDTDEFGVNDGGEDKRITYANVKSELKADLVASETSIGFVERATDAEALAGTDTTRYVTPYHLTYGNSVSASDVLKVSSDTERFATSGIIKTIRCGYIPFGGTLRIKFDGRNSGDTYYGTAQIFRNGVAVGTSRVLTNNLPYQTFSEDISGWNTGDLIQINLWSSNGYHTNYIRNFRIYFDYTTTTRTFQTTQD